MASLQASQSSCWGSVVADLRHFGSCAWLAVFLKSWKWFWGATLNIQCPFPHHRNAPVPFKWINTNNHKIILQKVQMQHCETKEQLLNRFSFFKLMCNILITQVILKIRALSSILLLIVEFWDFFTFISNCSYFIMKTKMPKPFSVNLVLCFLNKVVKLT